MLLLTLSLAYLPEPEPAEPWWKFIPLLAIAIWALWATLPRVLLTIRRPFAAKPAQRSGSEVNPRPSGGNSRCPYCHDTMRLYDRRSCSFCRANQHPQCWEEHGACAACFRG